MFWSIIIYHICKTHVHSYIKIIFIQKMLTKSSSVISEDVSCIVICRSINASVYLTIIFFSYCLPETITWTNADLLLTSSLKNNFSETLIEIHHITLRKCIWKYLLQNRVPFLKVLKYWYSGTLRLNTKMSSYQYRDPHVKDKTVS